MHLQYGNQEESRRGRTPFCTCVGLSVTFSQSLTMSAGNTKFGSASMMMSVVLGSSQYQRSVVICCYYNNYSPAVCYVMSLEKVSRPNPLQSVGGVLISLKPNSIYTLADSELVRTR